MTEKTPDEKVQRMLVNNYETAPELLEYHLCEVFKILETQDDVAGHNRVIFDIQLMVGEGMKDLVEKVVNDIILIGKAEVVKDG